MFFKNPQNSKLEGRSEEHICVERPEDGKYRIQPETVWNTVKRTAVDSQETG